MFFGEGKPIDVVVLSFRESVLVVEDYMEVRVGASCLFLELRRERDLERPSQLY